MDYKMLAKVQEGKRKHFCHEEKIDHVGFTSEPEKMSEAAGLSFEQQIPTHLRGLKDYEIELLLNKKKKQI